MKKISRLLALCIVTAVFASAAFLLTGCNNGNGNLDLRSDFEIYGGTIIVFEVGDTSRIDDVIKELNALFQENGFATIEIGRDSKHIFVKAANNLDHDVWQALIAQQKTYETQRALLLQLLDQQQQLDFQNGDDFIDEYALRDMGFGQEGLPIFR